MPWQECSKKHGPHSVRAARSRRPPLPFQRRQHLPPPHQRDPLQGALYREPRGHTESVHHGISVRYRTDCQYTA
jgi:hypothetical protein